MAQDIGTIKSIKQQALEEVAKERADKAKNAIVKKLRLLEDARSVVSNIEREIADLEVSIEEGSFVG
jgi:hypothetical protein